LSAIRPSQRSGPVFFIVLLFLLISSLYTLLYLQTTNTLENNGHWTSTKASLQRGVIGGVAYVITPVALNRNRLNLGALFGFQEVLTRQKLSPTEISFDFRLPEPSYLTFLYNKGAEGFSGLRLSRNPNYESAHLIGNAEGRFLRKEPFPLNSINEGWNRLRIEFGTVETSVFLNGQSLGTFQETLMGEMQMGFRGGPFEAAIGNVEIRLKDGQILRESFKNPKNFFVIFSVVFLLLILLNGLLFLWAGRKHRRNPQVKVLNYLLTANFLLLILHPILYTAQYHFLSKFTAVSKLYFKAAVALRNIPSSIETRDEALARLKSEYPNEGPASVQRILFIGTSQTWGAGVNRPDETFVHLLEQALNKEKANAYEVINGGISGEKAPSLFELYEKDWIRWTPKWVALNLSNNDLNSSKFKEAIQHFLELNQSKGIHTLLILEANTVESIRANLPTNHQILRDLALRFQAPLIDLHSCLVQKHDEGFLWWDFVHLSALGQKEAALCLEEPFRKILSSGKS